MLISASSVTSVSGMSLPHRLAPVASSGSVTASGFPHHHQHRNSPGAIGSRSRMAVITHTSVLERTTIISPPVTDSLPAPEHTFNQLVREGHYESELVALQVCVVARRTKVLNHDCPPLRSFSCSCRMKFIGRQLAPATPPPLMSRAPRQT